MNKSLKDLFQSNSNQGWFRTIIQFVKFGIVGLSNTAISYGIEMLCYYVLLINSPLAENVKVILTSVLAFIVSVTNSYFWNNKFVFVGGKKDWRGHLLAYLKTVACYGITGLILSPALKILLSNWGIPYWAASLASLIITIPLNFVMNKLWAFKSDKD